MPVVIVGQCGRNSGRICLFRLFLRALRCRGCADRVYVPSLARRVLWPSRGGVHWRVEQPTHTKALARMVSRNNLLRQRRYVQWLAILCAERAGLFEVRRRYQKGAMRRAG